MLFDRFRRKAPAARVPGVIYNPGTRIERLMFVCGLHRSGTTLLEQYLHARFEVTVLRGQVPENEGQHLQSTYSPASAFGGPGRFAFSAAMQSELDALCDRTACREAILAAWQPYLVGDFPTLLEKSPPNLTKIDWLRETFPGARFIIMVRDPRAVTTATRKWSSTSLEELMMHWSVAHSIALAQMRDEDCTVIRYEDFCADPAGAIADSRIGTWLVPRESPLALDQRFERLADSNARYLDAHECRSYGRGAWDAFGYEP